MLIDKNSIFDEENAHNEILDPKSIAIQALGNVINAAAPYAKDLGNAMLNAARDGVESLITGRRELEDWAQIAGKAVDEVKSTLEEQTCWQYVGGKINFKISPKNAKKVVISFDLYYQDENDKWKKVTAESDMYASNYTLAALEEIRSNGTISFEVE